MDKSATITLTISKDMESLFKGDPFFFEIDMLQGESRILPDGRTEYTFKVIDEHKLNWQKNSL